jgi:hypothetical protein
MTKVIKLNHVDNAEDFISKIKNKDLLIYEDVQGSQIYVKYNGDRFIIKPKSVKNDELNMIDLTVQQFYNQAFLYFNSLPDYIVNLINTNWWFVFEYFPDAQPANIEYKRKPKNSLILTCILKGSKHIYEHDEIIEYANLFDVDSLPVLFKGKLNGKQIEIINLFMNTSEKDLKYVFDEDNFAKFFYNMLNPFIENSFLMDKNEFNDNLEKIIIKIDGNEKYSFELLNPIHKKLSLNNDTEYVEIYSLILINFLEFCQLEELKNYKLQRLTKEELYIEFMCKLFNRYMENVYDDLLEWVFYIPEFFKDDKFKINVDLLTNKKTIEYIKSDPKIEYIFKVILGSFHKKRSKPIGLFTEKTVELFNKLVDDIDKKLDLLLNINREYRLKKSDVLNFEEFFDLEFNIDSTGKLYPDVYTQFKEEEIGAKKKKGVKKMGEEEFEIQKRPIK